MSPRRNADAAHIAPYLTHEVSHLGQTTLIPPETAGRMRQAKKKKGRTNPTPNSSSNTKGSTTRQAQMDEEVRYNTGPRQIRVPNPSSSSRTADRRSRRQDRRDNYDDDIPDYPPPPFDEAIATPALSVCPSTTTLINHSSTNNPPPLPFQVDTRPSERNSSDSDSDGSLELVERPPEAGPVQTNDRGRRRSRDLDLTADDEPPTPTAPQPKRRHLSLSPLRIFPHKPTPTPVQDRALSANPASPYRSAAFFRSTTSLKCPSTGSFFRLPTSALSSTSLGKPDFGKGRFGKGKERSSESLDSWEVVPRDGEDSHSLLSAIESIASPDSGSPSPTSPIFTFPPQNDRPANTTVRSPSRTPPPSVSNSSTTLSTNTVTPPAIGPPLTAARTRLNTGESSRSMSPASQHRLQGQAPSPSPSRANSPSLQNYPTLDNVDDPQQIAVDMPLPPTPTAIPVSLASSAHDHDHPSSMSGDDPHVMNTSQRRVLQHLNSSMPLSTSNTSGQLPIRAATVSAPRSTRPVSALPTYHGPHGPPLMSSSSVGDPVGDILPPIPPRSHQRPTPTPLSISYIPSTYSNSTISPGSAVSSGTLTPTRTPTDSHSGKHYPGRPLPHPPTPPSDGGLSTLPSPLSPTPVPSPKSESGRSGSPTLPIQNHAAVTTTKSNLKSNSKHNPNSLSRSLQTPTTTSPNRARIVDSLYGSRELEIFSDADSDTFSTRTAKLSTSTCPEGLLIDLDSDESGNESKTWNGTGSRVLDFERLAASVARGATTSPPTFPTTRTNPGPGPLRPSSPAHSHQFHHQRPYASSISAPLSISATSSTSSGRSDYYDAEGTGTGSTLVTERDQLAQHHFEETRAANSRDTRTQSRAQVGYHVGNRYGSDCNDTFDARLSPNSLYPVPAETSLSSVEETSTLYSHNDNVSNSRISLDSPPTNAGAVQVQGDEQGSSSLDLASSSSRNNSTNNHNNVYSEFTDLDLLVSRLDDSNQRNGLNYDTLLLLSDFMGPANPSESSTTVNNITISPTSVNANYSSSPSPHSALPMPLLGVVIVQRRRTTKDGRNKIKLSLLGSGVDKCGICLSQFKEGDHGAMSPPCKHAFHEKCLRRWLGMDRSTGEKKTCPICRVGLGPLPSS